MISEAEVETTLDFLLKAAPQAAKARANRIYLEEYRKTKKALLMGDAEISGVKAVASQEREAYANPAYAAHLLAMKDAIEADEAFRWKLVHAQAVIEAWRTMQANERIQAKI